MEYLLFSLGFVAIHTVVYVAAGVVAGRSREFYEGPDGLFTGFLHDMADPAQSRGVTLRMFPAQVARGVLMSVVLYPIVGALGELDYLIRALFLGGLMFVYADLASNVPFSNTIEGLVYMRRRFVARPVFVRVQGEAALYSVMFGLAAAWLLFL